MNKNSINLLEKALVHRYLLLSVLLVLLLTLVKLHGYNMGDFWEHNAVVKELETHPYSPGNPLLSVQAPHAFYSPYTLGVALFAKVSKLDTITALTIAGIFNLVLFLSAFKLFVSRISEYKQAPFYALLFVLLFWGPYTWYYSGFYNLDTIKYSLPYPSFFAIGITFLTLSIFIKTVNDKKYINYLFITAGIFLVLITHPLTFILLAVGLAAFTMSRMEISGKDFAFITGAVIGGLILAAIWPYYSIYELLTKEAAVYHANNKIMYINIIERIYPIFLVVPLLILRIKSDYRDPLALMFFGLLAVYIFGYYTEKWSYGRVISHLMITLQIILGIYVANLEENFRMNKYKIYISKLSFLILILVIITPISFGPVKNLLYNALKKTEKSYNKYNFLSNFTNRDDVILSDLKTNWYIPSFGGKIVASPKPLAFVHDNAERQKGVDLFFSNGASLNLQMSLIRKYKVRCLLLNKQADKNWQKAKHVFEDYGTVRYEDSNFVLIRFNQNKLAKAEL